METARCEPRGFCFEDDSLTGQMQSESMPSAAALPEPITPLLKWAGGKRWLVHHLPTLLPAEHQKYRYIEPFMGSGAIFFALQPTNALLSDSNAALIEMYRATSRSWKRVSEHLEQHAARHSDTYYYSVRGQAYATQVERAAQFLYLNRTCWNGLYRVNKNGAFNVPRGTKDAVLLASDDFPSAAKALRAASLESCDFQDVIDGAGRSDMLFVDPPYTVHHKHNGFVKYNEQLFSWEDQERLATSVKAAVSRGCKLILTNADHESIRKLYRGFGRHRVLSRHSIIAGDAGARKPFSELVITA